MSQASPGPFLEGADNVSSLERLQIRMVPGATTVKELDDQVAYRELLGN